MKEEGKASFEWTTRVMVCVFVLVTFEMEESEMGGSVSGVLEGQWYDGWVRRGCWDLRGYLCHRGHPWNR